MPKAAHTLTTSDRRRLPASAEGSALARRSEAPTRRGVLGGAAFLSALAAGGVAAAAPSASLAMIVAAHPDTELLRLCAVTANLQAEWDRMWDIWADLTPDDPQHCSLDEKMNSLIRQWEGLQDNICEIPARTAAGRQAKAQALRWMFPLNEAGHPNTDLENFTRRERMAWSLVHDVLAGRV